MFVMQSTIGLFSVNSSAVSRDRGYIGMRGSLSSVVSCLSIIPEHKHPLSTKACTIVVLLISALTKNGSVFSLASSLSTALGS